MGSILWKCLMKSASIVVHSSHSMLVVTETRAKWQSGIANLVTFILISISNFLKYVRTFPSSIAYYWTTTNVSLAWPQKLYALLFRLRPVRQHVHCNFGTLTSPEKLNSRSNYICILHHSLTILLQSPMSCFFRLRKNSSTSFTIISYAPKLSFKEMGFELRAFVRQCRLESFERKTSILSAQRNGYWSFICL